MFSTYLNFLAWNNVIEILQIKDVSPLRENDIENNYIKTLRFAIVMSFWCVLL